MSDNTRSHPVFHYSFLTFINLKLNNCFNPTSESLCFQQTRVDVQQSFLHCAIGPLAALTQTMSVRAVWIFPACPGSLSAAVCLKSSSCWIHAYAIFNFKYKNKTYSCAPTFRYLNQYKLF